MTLVLLILPILAVVCLFASAAFTTAPIRRRWLNDRERLESHSIATTSALWAIAILLLWIGLR